MWGRILRDDCVVLKIIIWALSVYFEFIRLDYEVEFEGEGLKIIFFGVTEKGSLQDHLRCLIIDEYEVIRYW